MGNKPYEYTHYHLRSQIFARVALAKHGGFELRECVVMGLRLVRDGSGAPVCDCMYEHEVNGAMW